MPTAKPEMTVRRILVCYCCEGGSSEGYRRAGLTPYGVDLFKWTDDQGKRHGFSRKRYPFPAHQGDVRTVLATLIAGGRVDFTHPDGTVEWLTLADFVAVHTSPPCQVNTAGTRALDRTVYPDLIAPTRRLLSNIYLPWVIENVPDAPLRNPITLCGTMFGLQAVDQDDVKVRLRRHRLFETNFRLAAPAPCDHTGDMQWAGAYGGARRTIAGARERHGGYVPSNETQRALMGIDWMTVAGLHQALPPVYTAWIGGQIVSHL